MKRALKPLALLGVLAGGVAIFLYLTGTKPRPQRRHHAAAVAAVEVVEALPVRMRVRVTAMGTVVPARQVTVLPEVGGRIVYVNSELVPGGLLRRGQGLVRIDPRDYDLAVEQLKAQVSQAELNLAQERGRQAVAIEEWKQIEQQVQPTAQGKKLALRETQVKSAEAALASARSALEQAEIRRQRTAIAAPFDSLVTEEFVDVGQVVGSGSKLATLVDRSVFWVRVAVPVDRLSWIDVPGVGQTERGSPAIVTQRMGGKVVVERQGRVVRLLGDLDPRGSLARVLVTIEHPLEGEGLPLLLGAQVSVMIEGQDVEGVVRLPGQALHDGDRIWIADGKSKLTSRKVELLWREGEEVVVRGPLAGERVVTSSLSAPVEGQPVRSSGEGADLGGPRGRAAGRELPRPAQAGGPT